MWSTRPATLADIPALRELCLDSVGADDYVLSFLDRFVRDSVTFVAWDGSRLVGMMVYDDTPDGGVWLHAARTRPAYRRQGVARALNRACEDLARGRHRKCLRLWAAATNTASVTASRTSGFEERARFTRMQTDAASAGTGPRLTPLDPKDDWSLLAHSPILERTAGYIFHDFYFLPLTRHEARRLARESALWRFGESAVSLSADFEDPSGRGLQIQLLAGDPAQALAAAPGIARSRGTIRVESFLPHDSPLLETARGVGFRFMEWGQEAILFERRLSP